MYHSSSNTLILTKKWSANAISKLGNRPSTLGLSLSVMIKSKSGKTSVLDTFCVCLCVRGEDWGLVGGWRPLPTRPQQYCDPASLVPFPSQFLFIFLYFLKYSLCGVFEEINVAMFKGDFVSARALIRRITVMIIILKAVC